MSSVRKSARTIPERYIYLPILLYPVHVAPMSPNRRTNLSFLCDTDTRLFRLEEEVPKSIHVTHHASDGNLFIRRVRVHQSVP